MSEVATSSSAESRWNRFVREFDWVARLIVGGIFVWSGSAHLANPYYFLSTVYQYELTTAPVGALIASYMPFLELLLAACLLSGCCQRAAWTVTSLLLLGFVAVQGSALSRGLKISCGCFGPEINRPIDASSISYTAALAVLAICATLAARNIPPAKPAVSGV
ncbi:MAG TPA: MauE/DoxX family redox-associated membrane protein [Schlesneria sp.]|jgi:uncharacterized membrane protein YphA (DoxX/SURF4 family)